MAIRGFTPDTVGMASLRPRLLPLEGFRTSVRLVIITDDLVKSKDLIVITGLLADQYTRIGI